MGEFPLSVLHIPLKILKELGHLYVGLSFNGCLVSTYVSYINSNNFSLGKYCSFHLCPVLMKPSMETCHLCLCKLTYVAQAGLVGIFFPGLWAKTKYKNRGTTLELSWWWWQEEHFCPLLFWVLILHVFFFWPQLPHSRLSSNCLTTLQEVIQTL